MIRKPDTAWSLLLAALAAGFLWAYWPTFAEMGRRWLYEPVYSHGFLIPGIAVFLLWWRSDLATSVGFRPSWWGLPLLLLGGGIRLVSAYFYLSGIDSFSLLPLLAGVVLLLGGWPAFRWAWPAVAFLGFMLPLPFTVETLFASKLQRISTVATTYTLQTIGYPALARGNVIQIGEHQVNVAEACSGLSMMMTFFALSTAFVMVVRRPLFDKLVLLVSAVPIAILSNVLRVGVTAVLMYADQTAAADFFHHRLAPVPTMLFALALLWLETWIIDHLLVSTDVKIHVTLGLPGGKQAGNGSSRPRGAQATA